MNNSDRGKYVYLWVFPPLDLEDKKDKKNSRKWPNKRPRKKSVLEDEFPAPLQEAFFGKGILIRSKEEDAAILDSDSDGEKNSPGPISSVLEPSEPFIIPKVPSPTPATAVSHFHR